MHPKKKGRRIGAGLSLDKWGGRISKYDKRQVLEKQKQLKAKQVNKFKRLKRRLEAEGRLAAHLLPQVGRGTLAPMAAAVTAAGSGGTQEAYCSKRGCFKVGVCCWDQQLVHTVQLCYAYVLQQSILGGGGCYKWILSPLSGTLHTG
jgi:hypothetical protein